MDEEGLASRKTRWAGLCAGQGLSLANCNVGQPVSGGLSSTDWQVIAILRTLDLYVHVNLRFNMSLSCALVVPRQYELFI